MWETRLYSYTESLKHKRTFSLLYTACSHRVHSCLTLDHFCFSSCDSSASRETFQIAQAWHPEESEPHWGTIKNPFQTHLKAKLTFNPKCTTDTSKLCFPQCIIHVFHLSAFIKVLPGFRIWIYNQPSSFDSCGLWLSFVIINQGHLMIDVLLL